MRTPFLISIGVLLAACSTKLPTKHPSAPVSEIPLVSGQSSLPGQAPFVKPGFQNYRYRTSSVGAEFTLNDARSLAASRFDGSAISNVTVKPIKHLNAISQYKIESDALTPDSDVYLAVVSGDLRWPFPAHIASADGKVYVPRGHTAYVLIDPQNARIVAARMLRNQKRPFFVQSR